MIKSKNVNEIFLFPNKPWANDGWLLVRLLPCPFKLISNGNMARMWDNCFSD